MYMVLTVTEYVRIFLYADYIDCMLEQNKICKYGLHSSNFTCAY